MDDNIEKLKLENPDISNLELHFYNMKFHGVYEKELEEGDSRPVFFLFDNNYFAIISFMISEKSPYTSEDGTLKYNGMPLPFRAVQAMRLGYSLPYYYFRGPLGPVHPTLGDENILNTSFNPLCGGCDFCFYGYRNRHLKNLTPKEGIELVKKETGITDFSVFDEIAVVTGRFPSEEKTKEHILGIIEEAKKHNFKGRIFYIGSQIVSPESIKEIFDALGDPKLFKISYTIERFFNRHTVMHGTKGLKTLPEIIQDLKTIKETGISFLQYNYLVGIENLDDFKKGAIQLVPYATPHISIFRKTGLTPNELSICDDYKKMGTAYIVEIKKHYEQIYGKKIIGNNYANLWPWPIKDINVDYYLNESRKFWQSYKVFKSYRTK